MNKFMLTQPKRTLGRNTFTDQRGIGGAAEGEPVYNGYFKIFDITTTDSNGNSQFRVAVADGETWNPETQTSGRQWYDAFFYGEKRLTNKSISYVKSGVLTPPTPPAKESSDPYVTFYVVFWLDVLRGVHPDVFGDDSTPIANVYVTESLPVESRRYLYKTIGRLNFYSVKKPATEDTPEVYVARMEVVQEHKEGRIVFNEPDYYVGYFGLFQFSTNQIVIPGGHDVQLVTPQHRIKVTLPVPTVVQLEAKAGVYVIYLAIDVLRGISTTALSAETPVVSAKVALTKMPSNTRRWYYVSLGTVRVVTTTVNNQQQISRLEITQPVPDTGGADDLYLETNLYTGQFALFDYESNKAWCLGGSTDLPGADDVPEQAVEGVAGRDSTKIYLVASWDGTNYSAEVSGSSTTEDARIYLGEVSANGAVTQDYQSGRAYFGDRYWL